jgi:hypothetical protein
MAAILLETRHVKTYDDYLLHRPAFAAARHAVDQYLAHGPGPVAQKTDQRPGQSDRACRRDDCHASGPGHASRTNGHHHHADGSRSPGSDHDPGCPCRTSGSGHVNGPDCPGHASGSRHAR